MLSNYRFTSMTKKILVMLSEWGYWGEELIGPLDVLTKAGYSLDFMTAFGRKPPALPPSMEEGYLDPPLNKVVTDAHFAKRTTEVHESNLLSKPINLSEKLSLMPKKFWINNKRGPIRCGLVLT